MSIYNCFKPFDLTSLLEQNRFSSYTHDFIPLSDPNLNKLIDTHKMDLEYEKDGRIIYIQEKDDSGSEGPRFEDKEEDPLGL